jgi:homeobox-leucine zipper protein
VIGEMSFDEQHLRLYNVRLRDEIDRISSIAAKYVGKPAGSNASSAAVLHPPSSLSSHHLPGTDVLALHHGAARWHWQAAGDRTYRGRHGGARMVQLDEPL